MLHPPNSKVAGVCGDIGAAITPESKLKLEVSDWLNLCGYFFERMNSGKVKVKGGWMQLHPVGTADFLVFQHNRVYWIELKAPGCKTAKARVEAQAAFAERVRSYGHRYAICESFEDVKAFLAVSTR